MNSTDYCTLNSPCQNGGNCSLVRSHIFLCYHDRKIIALSIISISSIHRTMRQIGTSAPAPVDGKEPTVMWSETAQW